MANTPYYVKAESDAITAYLKKSLGTGFIGTVTPNVGGVPQLNGLPITENGYYFISATGDYGDIVNIQLGDQIVILEVRSIETTAIYSTIIIPITLVIDSALDINSVNALRNSVITEALALKADFDDLENGTNIDAGAWGDVLGLDDKADKTEVESIKSALVVPYSYTNPTSSITNVSQTIEKGSSLSAFNIDISFNQNDAGLANGYSLEQDNVEISTTQSTSVTLNNIISNIVFRGIVTYNQGDIENDNFGDPSPTGRIEAGSVTSGTRTITARYKQFYGVTATDVVNSSQVRALPNSNFDNSNSFSSGVISETKYVIAIPSTKTLSSVITANNENITSNFVLTTFLVEDASLSNTSTYKIYTLTTVAPLGISANITLS